MNEVCIDFETICSDPQLVGEPISKQWATFYRAIEGLPLDEEGIEIFRACTGRDRYEPRIFNEVTAIVGRRAEKTSTGLKYLLWKSLTTPAWFQKHKGTLRIPIIAQDLRVAKDIKRAAEALLLGSPLLRNEVDEVLTSEIQLRNGISLTCYPATWRSTRGLTCPAALLDELAFVTIEGASDVELVRQVRPTMIRFGETRRLIKLTTPWIKGGLVYDEFSHRDERPDLLVWQASTTFMTPRVSVELLEKERVADPAYFAREYEAQFTDDTEAFLPGADIDFAVRKGVREVPFSESLKGQYFAAIDASSLTGRDRFVFGIGHRASRGNSGVGFSVDLLRGWTRDTVPAVCDEVASTAKAYGIRTITADQHGFHFLRELMKQRGVEMEQLPFTVRSKSEIFFDLKVSLGQGRVQLLDQAESLRELRILQSRRTSGGNYAIAAPRNMHDDYCCLLALLAHRAQHGGSSSFTGFLAVGGKSGVQVIHANDNSDLPPGVEVDRIWWRK
ncbi:MAG TPA: hypothetical protein VNK23_12110 [Candidatus Dormibacteraeota bacterium]|nr:hypothetical protein [Candidatus Dormibacteraeota bacterium]